MDFSPLRFMELQSMQRTANNPRLLDRQARFYANRVVKAEFGIVYGRGDFYDGPLSRQDRKAAIAEMVESVVARLVASVDGKDVSSLPLHEQLAAEDWMEGVRGSNFRLCADLLQTQP